MPNTNSLIQFKKGTFTNLQRMNDAVNYPSDNAKIEDGCFYLATAATADSTRLFIGKVEGNTKKVVPVNQGIITVDTIENLRALSNTAFQDGDFAYVSTGNILAVRSGNTWVQINRSAEDDQYLSDLALDITITNGVANVQTVATVMNSSEDAPETNLKIGAAGGVDVSIDNTTKTVTLTGTQYEIGASHVAAGAQVTLDSTKADDSSFVIKGNATSGIVSVDADASGNIVIDARDTVVSRVDVDDTTGFSITTYDTNGDSSQAGTINPTIKYGGSGTDTATFAGSETTLNVYSISDIDQKFRTLDALKYVGVVGGTGNTQYPNISGLTNNKIGYVYKIAEAMTYNDQVNSKSYNLKPGDLIIANGTEGSDGYISSGLYYDVVPAGDEDTTHTLVGTSNGVELRDAGDNPRGALEIVQGSNTAITFDSATNGTGKKITIAHGATSATGATNATANAGTAISQQALDDGGQVTLTAVTGVKKDSFGHVTSVDTVAFTPIDTNVTLSSYDDTVADATGNLANKQVSITSAINFTKGNGDPMNDTSVFNLKSDNLDIFKDTDDSNNTTAKINFYWGTF